MALVNERIERLRALLANDIDKIKAMPKHRAKHNHHDDTSDDEAQDCAGSDSGLRPEDHLEEDSQIGDQHSAEADTKRPVNSEDPDTQIRAEAEDFASMKFQPKPKAAAREIRTRIIKYETDSEAEGSSDSDLDPGPQFEDTRVGTLPTTDQGFCPVKLVSRLPYRALAVGLHKSLCDPVAEAFFDNGKFWNRRWDLYYVWPIGEEKPKPLPLIPESQFIDLLHDIDGAFPRLRLQHRVKDYREALVILDFPDHPDLKPRFLGETTSRANYDTLYNLMPNQQYRPRGEKPAAGPPHSKTLEAFKQMMEETAELTKSKNKAARGRRKEDRIYRQRLIIKQMKRAQRYLGLRPKSDKPLWSVQFPPLDLQKPAPHPFEQDAVLICVDVEAYEHNHNIITEVGIASLDTRHLNGIAPGPKGENWHDFILARHLRITENSHYENKHYINGCANNFDFGQSEFINLDDICDVMEMAFNPVDENGDTRTVLFIGHDAEADINFLQKLSFNPLSPNHVLETLDTAHLYRALRRDNSTRSLATIFYDFDMAGFYFHNAGNDAMYTMRALLTIVLADAQTRSMMPEDRERLWSERVQQRVQEKVDQAREAAAEDAEGWSDEDWDDGGEAPVEKKLDDGKAKRPEGLSGGMGGSFSQNRAPSYRLQSTPPTFKPRSHGMAISSGAPVAAHRDTIPRNNEATQSAFVGFSDAMASHLPGGRSRGRATGTPRGGGRGGRRSNWRGGGSPGGQNTSFKG